MLEINVAANELTAVLLDFEASARVAILDSCSRDSGDSRYLIATAYPRENFEFACTTETEAFDVLRFLDERLAADNQKSDSAALFGGGICVATLSYEFGLLFENIVARPKEFAGFDEPAATFAFYETFAVHDYRTGKTFVVGKDQAGFAKLIADKRRALKIVDLEKTPDARIGAALELPAFVGSNFTKNQYLSAVETIKNHIRRGDIYQANLTQQLRAELPAGKTPAQIFRHLRVNHPAQFAAYIRRERDEIVSASPERFVKVQSLKSKVQSRKIVVASPIKGTRRRGANLEEDWRLRNELENSVKDRAENTMIVDLLRNDIGRVCEFGSVRATRVCELETHASLFHLVSTIEGVLRPDATIGDLLRAAFPCGSITGAPKISAMQIIDRIETAARNVSMGAIGYFAFDGSLDLNVAIRTMTIRDNQAIFNVGGGIIADSDSEAEYQESLLKARALLNTLTV